MMTDLAAQKEDYFWLFGYSSDTSTMEYGGTNIDFNTDPPDIYYQYREMSMDIANASICDSLGNLLFYTNGIGISNASHELMENGDGLNPSSFREDWVDIGYPLYQGVMILPLPGDPNLYYLFHEERSWAPDDPSYLTKIYTLYYTLIDMQANNGLGRVIEKNIPVIQDTLNYGKITATKHANGTDWWLLIPVFDSNQYYRILFTASGITSIDIQEVGDFVYSGLGQAVFSPDGTKYARYELKNINIGNFLNIYDFDRCTGLLSNHEQFNIIDTAYAGGVAISPNSRYLYVPSYGYTYQYDLEADDVEATKDTVAIYDGYIAPYFATTFFLAQLAPNGKIYINSNSGVNTLHVIHNPDQGGDACDFEQHGIQLPTFNAASMPNFPNYRLGPAPQSDTCELVSTINPVEEKLLDVQVFPNPATDRIEISFEPQEEQLVWDLYDNMGQKVISQLLLPFTGNKEIDIGTLTPGLYYWVLQSQEGRITDRGKLVVM